jgi:DNA helicase IV
LSAEERAVLEQESSWLERVQRSLAQARAAREQRAAEARLRAPDVDVVRALRTEASSASEDDLPTLLHELSVRQTLLARPALDPLPDPNCPYIAHLVLTEGGGEKHYFLGQKTHLDGAAGVRIVDWRVAPVARIFYGYREGDEYEEQYPGRVAEGTVRARRIVVIEAGELKQIVAGAFVLEQIHGVWRSRPRSAFAIASGGEGSAVRHELGVAGRAPSVTALLDEQQFAAVSAPAERPLLVLGSAGSGKTTVALHRLARIATIDPEGFPLARMRVVVPEEGLARLSRRLLEPLGVAGAQVSTLDGWAIELAKRAFMRLPRLCPDTPALVSSLKRHPALYRALRPRLALKKPRTKPPSLKRIRRQLAELYSDREFLSGVVNDAQGTLSLAAIEDTVRHTMAQLADTVDEQLAAISDRTRLETLDQRSIAEATPEDVAHTLDLEDLPILLAILAWRGQLALEPLSHLVLDEAEDFSLFDLFVLGQELGEPKSVTLAGDAAQQTQSSFAGFEPALAELGVGDAEVCRLAVSYRCPRPIFELAQAIRGPLAGDAPASPAREGAPVGVFRFPNSEQAALFAASELRDLVEREPAASVAVVARDADAARRFYALLPEGSARLVLSGEFSFEPGVDVTDLDNVKGLEFDYVVVPDATALGYPVTDDARRRLHVAVTRAVAKLWLISGGEPSPLLKDADLGLVPVSSERC